jgi:hypothetical protein
MRILRTTEVFSVIFEDRERNPFSLHRRNELLPVHWVSKRGPSWGLAYFKLRQDSGVVCRGSVKRQHCGIWTRKSSPGLNLKHESNQPDVFPYHVKTKTSMTMTTQSERKDGFESKRCACHRDTHIVTIELEFIIFL